MIWQIYLTGANYLNSLLSANDYIVNIPNCNSFWTGNLTYSWFWQKLKCVLISALCDECDESNLQFNISCVQLLVYINANILVHLCNSLFPLFPAPCSPQNLETVADCSVDSLLSKWDNAEGALYYTVTAMGNYRNNNSYNCSSVSNSCVMKGVKCGDHLSVTIRSFDNDCPSPTVLGPPAETSEEHMLEQGWAISVHEGRCSCRF